MDLTREEADLFQRQLEDVVGYMREIAGLDLEGIEPTSHPVPMSNVMRTDEARDGLKSNEALANAPRHKDGQFLVPRIVE